MQDNAAFIKFVYQNKKLIPSGETNLLRYRQFLAGLKESQEVNIVFEAVNDNGSLAQKAKIHILIRKISSETGTSVDFIKKEIKKRSGLSYDGESYKSFADCSVEELGLVLETIKELCEFLNINFT